MGFSEEAIDHMYMGKFMDMLVTYTEMNTPKEEKKEPEKKIARLSDL